MQPVEAAAPATAGAYRWIILLVVWFGYLLSFVDRLIWTSVGSMAASAYGLSLAALGLFVTAFYAGYVVSQALTGLASDWIGPRLMLVIALVPLGAFTFAFGLTSSVTLGLVLQALMGLTAGADFAAGVKLIVSWFPVQQRGRAMGLFMTATSLGVVVTNAAVPRALHYVAWPAVYHVAGLVTAAFGALCYVVLRDSPAGETTPPIRWSDLRAMMASRQYVFIVLAGLGGVWGTWGYAIWASSLMTRGLHFSAVTAGGIVAAFGIVAVAGKPAIGLVSDFLGGRRRSLVMIDLLLFSALLVLTGRLGTVTQFWIVAPFLGLTAFAYSPLSNTMAAEAGGNAAGSAAGISAAIGSIGTMIVPLVVGVGFQATRSYEVAFAILAAGPFLGALCMLAVRDISTEHRTIEDAAHVR